MPPVTDWAPPPWTPVTQTLLYSADLESRGVLGNCLQAAFASALGFELDAVPHFAAFHWWLPAARLWLRGRSLDVREVPEIPPGRSVVIGTTIRSRQQGGSTHAVIGDRGRIAWDPHPSHSGLVSILRVFELVARTTKEPSSCAYCGHQFPGA